MCSALEFRVVESRKTMNNDRVRIGLDARAAAAGTQDVATEGTYVTVLLLCYVRHAAGSVSIV